MNQVPQYSRENRSHSWKILLIIVDQTTHYNQLRRISFWQLYPRHKRYLRRYSNVEDITSNICMCTLAKLTLPNRNPTRSDAKNGLILFLAFRPWHQLHGFRFLIFQFILAIVSIFYVLFVYQEWQWNVITRHSKAQLSTSTFSICLKIISASSTDDRENIYYHFVKKEIATLDAKRMRSNFFGISAMQKNAFYS